MSVNHKCFSSLLAPALLISTTLAARNGSFEQIQVPGPSLEGDHVNRIYDRLIEHVMPMFSETLNNTQ